MDGKIIDHIYHTQKLYYELQQTAQLLSGLAPSDKVILFSDCFPDNQIKISHCTRNLIIRAFEENMRRIEEELEEL